jgi:prepilin signal peptidase PulO-like enzyme (type II secretory pathway)
MIRHMAGGERPDLLVEHPNRDKATVKATKIVVVLLLLLSAALMTFVAIGGWEAMGGAKPILVAYVLVYLLLAFYAARWNRGTLPVSAALAIVLLIFAAIAGPQWLERDAVGFTDPAVASEALGIVTLLLVPVQVLLIAFAMRGFAQNWHVEVERRPEHRPHRGTAATA